MLVCLRFHFSLGQQAYDTLMIYWPGWRFHRIWYHLNGCLFKNRKITFYSVKKYFYHRKIFNLPRPRVWAKYDGAIDGARLIVPPKFDGASVPFPPWDPHDTQPSIYKLSLDLKDLILPLDGSIVPLKIGYIGVSGDVTSDFKLFFSPFRFWPRPWKHKLSQQLQQYLEQRETTMIMTIMTPHITATTMPIAL